MTKAELEKLSGELADIMQQINEIADANPNIMIYFDDNEFAESFSSICQSFDTKLGFFRKRLSKISKHLPKTRTRRVKLT